jgi:hypothetical protein
MEDHPTVPRLVTINKGKPSTKMDHAHPFSSSQTVSLPEGIPLDIPIISLYSNSHSYLDVLFVFMNH